MKRTETFFTTWNVKPIDIHLPRRTSGIPMPKPTAPTASIPTFDIFGRYMAFVVMTHVDKQHALSILPRELELNPVPGVPANRHPVMYSFGTQFKVRADCPNSLTYKYDEALMGLCNLKLRHDDGSTSGPYYFMTDVRLNDKTALDVGVVMGFPKQMADIVTAADGYAIETGGRLLMNGQWSRIGDDFDSTLPNFREVEPFMKQPVITRTALGQYLVIDFRIDTANAWMRAMSAEIQISGSELAGMPAGRYAFEGIDRTAGGMGGGYYSSHEWVMHPPTPINLQSATSIRKSGEKYR